MIKKIKGHHVLIGFVAFFGIVFAVNAVFVTQAIRTFRGEDEPRSYIQGINYNDVLARRDAQAELGWTAISSVSADDIRLEISDADGNGVTELDLDARLRHPTDSSLDIVLTLRGDGPGVYTTQADIPAGLWTLVVSTSDGPPFEMEQEIWLR